MTSRFRFRLASTPTIGPLALTPALLLCLALAGCGDAFQPMRMSYVESDQLATALKDKPDLQKAVREQMAALFGDDPQHIKVPKGSGLPGGGIHLASHRQDESGKAQRVYIARPGEGREGARPQEGGYGLYRKHCLHCHGVSGAGDGPTSAFLYPRPRDYRRGIFKFTSTPTGYQPARADLIKTVRHGLHGTSMPAFESLMTDVEIEQVVDYMTFLSMRGMTELALIDEAAATGELPAETAAEVAQSVFTKWKSADAQMVNPPVPRTPSSAESIARGKELFLGLNKTGNKVDCTSCHGPQALGNGPSFIAQEVFNDVVFGGDPSAMADRLEEKVKEVAGERGEAEGNKLREAWKNSLDDWGFPLRPANLNRGVYKGGRRPIDLYWRIAKGINGAKMPAHYPTIEPEKIWDLVNFVLALPYDPSLLEGATLPTASPASAPKVAGR